ncbi:MAG TPA: lytic transglycosylase domain-containing protein [Pyrinomonadaceae bacterium]|jgi:soluble lytic murein transglycosylase-like protein
MKKLYFVSMLALVCTVPVVAQSGYRFDNFDTPNGVRVESAQGSLVVETPAETVRPLSKKFRAGDNAELRPASLVYTRSMAMTASKSLDGFTTGDPKIDAIIVEAGARNGVDPVLLYAQMHQESSFKRSAVSPKGARGLMQLMPFTAARFGVKDIFDPRQNIEGGARYMRYLLNAFDGDVALALAGYNAGEGAVMKYGRHVPPYRETQEYVRRITGRYRLMRDPETAHEARPATATEVAAAATEPPIPLTIYERHVFAVRLPDGRLQLVSQ